MRHYGFLLGLKFREPSDESSSFLQKSKLIWPNLNDDFIWFQSYQLLTFLIKSIWFDQTELKYDSNPWNSYLLPKRNDSASCSDFFSDSFDSSEFLLPLKWFLSLLQEANIYWKWELSTIWAFSILERKRALKKYKGLCSKETDISALPSP